MGDVPWGRPAPLPWVLTAGNPDRLREQARALSARVEATPPAELAELASSVAGEAAALPHRAVVFGRERDEILSELGGVARGAPSAGVAQGKACAGARVAFVFSPLRAEYPGMALGLLARYPTFADRMAACEEGLAPLVEWSLDDVLHGREDSPPFARLDVSQPVLFAACYSLAELWRSFGVHADAVLGHSVGEIAAAAACSGLSLSDAMRVAATWGRSSMRLEGTGAMASLPLSAEETERRIEPWREHLAISGLNAPNRTAVSGDAAAIKALLAALAIDGVSGRSMKIDAPGHTPLMAPIHDWFVEELAAISPRAGTVPFYSTVEGGPVDSASLNADYWSRNLRQPVRFEAAMGALRDAGHTVFVEIGPRPMLTGAIEEILAGDEAVAVGSWEQGEASQFPLQLAEAYVLGVEVDWGAMCRAQREALPLSTPPATPGMGWRTASLELVRQQLAAVLGVAPDDDLLETTSFRDLGLDSQAALALRNRLVAATGLDLAKTAVFDHPDVETLARHLQQLESGVSADAIPALRRSSGDAGAPIAIVGMSCRYPGGANSPQKLWELVAQGREAIGDFPADRGWDLDRLFDPDPEKPGTSYVCRGGFLEDATQFDAEFFAIGPREARAMDPQQRVLLECAWEAIEAAGIDPAALRREPVGVFIGAFASAYGPSIRGAGEGVAGHLLTGTTPSVISGRVAYAFGLEGPAMTVDTACSSSLVALHLACQALRAGECDLALAGGVTLMSTPDLFVEFSRQRVLAPDGRCKSFAAEADGTGWSEGSGLLVLEPLAEAQAKGRRVLAVVRGSAINQDGASNGLTAPSGRAQERVIRQALANAGVSAAEVDAVEAHGTGTALGDPIEAQALLATYGRERGGSAPLRLGSVKSNIGHCSAAAGVAGAIKIVMAMRHGMLPKSLHADRPSPRIPWEKGEVDLLQEPTQWPRTESRPRRAAVSSFGISGTNAHLVLEEAPEPEGPAPPRPGRSSIPLLLSAKSETALREQAERLAGHLRDNPSVALLDVAFSLASRARLEHRAVLVGDRPRLLAGLASVAAAEGAPGLIEGKTGRRRETAFVFPGQGSQWVGMGMELWRASPRFAAKMRSCEAALSEFVDWSLKEVLEEETALERVDIVQPALFAVMVSLADLWRSYGVQPAVVIGHSQGEIAAAHVAGALSLSDAARVIALRSQAIAEIAEQGGMVSVAAGEQWVTERVAGEERLAIAAVNAPSTIVVAGEPEALEGFLAACEADGVRARRIAVDYASHTAQVDAIGERLLADLAPISPERERIPIFSTATGAQIDGRTLDAEHWNRNLRDPVRFADAIAALAAGGIETFVEVSPHPVLTVAIEERAGVTALGTLRRDQPGPDRFMLSLAAAHAHGVEVDWSRALAGGRLTDLPPYPFQRRRHWLEAGDGADHSASGQTPGGYGREADGSLLGLTWVPASPGDSEARLAVLGESELRGAERHADLDAVAVARQAGKTSIDAIAVEIGGRADPREACRHALALLQEFLADERLDGCRLVFVTRGALAADEGDDVHDPVAGAVWGLVRSAQSEHPGRFALIDLDRGEASEEVLAKALASSGEVQLALRGGRALVPRLTHLTHLTHLRETAPIDPNCTVLITGGTGLLGRRLAAHLARRHGARHLVLVSRRGTGAEGVAELSELGCEIAIEPCDVSDRAQLEALLRRIPAERPLRTVVHAAGVLDDGTVASLTPDQLDAALAPKAMAAWHLHELTRDMDLDAFVLFSSLAGTLGGAGQANYAAANASLDALAAHRRAHGLPAVALAWGVWEEASGMTRSLGDADLARIARDGVAPLPTRQALQLFDAALGSEEALIFPVRLDLGSLCARARSGTLQPLLEALAPAQDPRGAARERSLTDRLALLPEEKREPLLLELVRREVATVLGHPSSGAVDPGRPFKDLGFDSLTAVDLRNGLNRATGLSLNATLAFDYPTPRAVAGKLLADLEGNSAKPPARSNGRGALDTAEERVLGDIDNLDLAGLVERSLGKANDVGA